MSNQQQDEGIGVCTAVFGKIVAEGLGTGVSLTNNKRKAQGVCIAVYEKTVAEGIGTQAQISKAK